MAARKAAATRVRFQFRKAPDGSIQVYGLHTSARSGMDSVPTVEMRWNPDKTALEALLDGGISIIWTPNDEPLPTEPLIFPIAPEPVETLLVHPIPERLDTELEVFPAVDDITWQDYILVFPIESGIPPLYIVFAKPAVRPLEVGSASELQSRSRKDGLDVDHIPSQAALERSIKANSPDLDKADIKKLMQKAASIAIPVHIHQKYSETYGERNSKAKQIKDAADLRAAVDSNFDAIKPFLLEESYTETNLEQARSTLYKINEE